MGASPKPGANIVNLVYLCAMKKASRLHSLLCPLLFAALLPCLAACSVKGERYLAGDLLFFGTSAAAPGSMDEAIVAATGVSSAPATVSAGATASSAPDSVSSGATAFSAPDSVFAAPDYTHVAIVIGRNLRGQVRIIDATPSFGVSLRTLPELESGEVMAHYRLDPSAYGGSCRGFSHGDVWQAAHRQAARRKVCRQAVRRARGFIGEPYDFLYIPDNGSHYCSELVYDAFMIDGKPLFRAHPMNFKAADGTFPQYWLDLFESNASAIPQGLPGTNPNDMSRDPSLQLLSIIHF